MMLGHFGCFIMNLLDGRVCLVVDGCFRVIHIRECSHIDMKLHDIEPVDA